MFHLRKSMFWRVCSSWTALLAGLTAFVTTKEKIILRYIFVCDGRARAGSLGTIYLYPVDICRGGQPWVGRGDRVCLRIVSTEVVKNTKVLIVVGEIAGKAYPVSFRIFLRWYVCLGIYAAVCCFVFSSFFWLL